MVSRLPFLSSLVATLTLLPWMAVGPTALRADDITRPAAVESLCREIDRRLSSVSYSMCTELGLEPSGAFSVRGRPILARTLPPTSLGDPVFRQTSGLQRVHRPGRILLIGGSHGDELSAVSITFRWLERLLEQPDQRFHWRIAPLINPDGLLDGRPRRTNANGVDLNRNMPSENWTREAHEWWATKTQRNPRRYPGPVPLSEPESRWLHDEIRSFRPDAIVSLHAPYNNVDFDGPPEGPQRLGSLQLKYLGTFPGSLGRFGAESNLPIVTIELPSAQIMPSEKEQQAIWRDLLDYLAGKVTEREH